MTKENRFEGLMGVVGKNKNVQTSKPGNDSDLKSQSQADVYSAQSDAQTSKSKKKASSKSNVETSKSLSISTSNKPDIQTSATEADASNQNISTSKRLNSQTFKAKSSNPDYTRTTVYLPKKMHKKLKAIAVDEEREMSSIVEELIETWLSFRM